MENIKIGKREINPLFIVVLGIIVGAILFQQGFIHLGTHISQEVDYCTTIRDCPPYVIKDAGSVGWDCKYEPYHCDVTCQYAKTNTVYKGGDRQCYTSPNKQYCTGSNACTIKGALPITEAQKLKDTCSETDGGDVPYIKGTTTQVYDGKTKSYDDVCKTISFTSYDKSVLYEAYCGGGGIAIKRYDDCFGTDSCKNGKCFLEKDCELREQYVGVGVCPTICDDFCLHMGYVGGTCVGGDCYCCNKLGSITTTTTTTINIPTTTLPPCRVIGFARECKDYCYTQWDDMGYCSYNSMIACQNSCPIPGCNPNTNLAWNVCINDCNEQVNKGYCTAEQLHDQCLKYCHELIPTTTIPSVTTTIPVIPQPVCDGLMIGSTCISLIVIVILSIVLVIALVYSKRNEKE